ncbi:hypothetical protein D1872_337090 [compost metagenome]
MSSIAARVEATDELAVLLSDDSGSSHHHLRTADSGRYAVDWRVFCQFHEEFANE